MSLVVSNPVPSNGSTLGPNAAVQFDLTDAVHGAPSFVALLITYGPGGSPAAENAYDSSDEFSAPFEEGSTIAAITNGFRFVLQRQGGWLQDEISIIVIATDGVGAQFWDDSLGWDIDQPSPNQADLDVANQIVSVLGSPWVVGTNVFTGEVRPIETGIPEQAIFCKESSGPQATPVFGGPSAPSLKYLRVQVRVRSNSGDSAGGLAIARAVWAALEKQIFDNYVMCRAQQSSPVYLEQDASDCHHWSINVVLDLFS